jgi:putative ABC transport system permease protein
MATPPRPPIATRIFRALLRLLPVDFRIEHGREMEQVFRSQRRDAGNEGTIRAVAGLWLETVRDLLTTAPLQHAAMLRQDAGYALRSLRRTPVFTTAALLTLAIGISASAGIFTIINAFLFRPLPVDRPDELVSIATLDDHIELPHGLSLPDLKDYAELTDVFAGMLGYTQRGAWMNAGGSPERIVIEAVTENTFLLLGARPLIGRVLAPADLRTPVAVLAHDYWQARFAGDSTIVGRTIRLNEETFTIVGVVEPRFKGLDSLIRISAFVPLSMLDRLNAMPAGETIIEARDRHALNVVGRLRPGVTIESARSALRVKSQILASLYPATNRNVSLLVVPETHARPVPQNGPMFHVGAAALAMLAGLLLLITSANVANMLLARAASRGREMALRAALGARRGRVVRQLVTESLVLSIIGGVTAALLSMFLAAAMERGIAALSFEVPLQVNFAIDWRVLAAIFAVAAAAGVVSSLAPALYARRADVNAVLKAAGRTSSGTGPGRLRGMLVVAQVAVSLVLLIVGGLFVKTLDRARTVDLGFRSAGVLLASVDLSRSTYSTATRADYYRAARDRAAALPGVRTAAWISALSFGSSLDSVELRPAGTSADEAGRQSFSVSVSPEYFAAAAVPLVSGRMFDERDAADSPSVIVVNQTLAELLWPGKNPLGRRLLLGAPGTPAEVVGVVRNGKYVFLWEAPRAMLFRPLTQDTPRSASLEIVTAGDPTAMAGTLRMALGAIDPGVPVYGIQSMDQYLENGSALLLFRIGALFTGVFGALGLIMASIGLYGVVAYDTTRRTHEIGVRMALGALRATIIRDVLIRGGRLAASGAMLGMMLAAGLTWLLRAMFLGVSPFDGSIYLGTAVLLIGVCLLASFVPARKAATSDPVTALRAD